MSLGPCYHNFLGQSVCEHCGLDESTYLRLQLVTAAERIRSLEDLVRLLESSVKLYESLDYGSTE